MSLPSDSCGFLGKVEEMAKSVTDGVEDWNVLLAK